MSEYTPIKPAQVLLGLAASAMIMIAGPSLAAPKDADSLDANGDGKVTLLEFQAGRGGRMMTRLDANKDGKLSKDEFAALRHGGPEAAATPESDPGKGQGHGKGGGRMWSRIDADNDGLVSKAELDTFLAGRFTRMDADNDGSLTLAELKPGTGKAKVGL